VTLQLKKKPDGSLRSQFWYGDFLVGGKRWVVSTGVSVAGKPGSKEFERSRGAAQAAHDRILAEYRARDNDAKLAERIIEHRQGHKRTTHRVADMVALFERIPRRRKPGEAYLKQCRLICQMFTESFPNRKESSPLDRVSAAAVASFMAQQEARNASVRTWNSYYECLKSVFRTYAPHSPAYLDYFCKTPRRTDNPIHRRPFSASDLAAILEAARGQPICDLIVTAACTGMRRGDVAKLRWKSVDLAGGFLTVKTEKTGNMIDVPILPQLEAVLRQRTADDKKGEFVFPWAEAIYRKRPDVLDRLLREVLHKAGFVADEEAVRASGTPTPPAEELLRMGRALIPQLKIGRAKRERITAVFEKYMAGATVPAIAQGMDLSRGTVSGLLKEMSDHLHHPIIRGKRVPEPPAVVRGTLLAEAEGSRLRRASLHGWHAMRTTFITTALSAGVPIELVRRVTGHTTTDVVLRHYFKPGRDEFKKAMLAALSDRMPG